VVCGGVRLDVKWNKPVKHRHPTFSWVYLLKHNIIEKQRIPNNNEYEEGEMHNMEIKITKKKKNNEP